MEVGLYIFNNKDRALTESMRFCHFSNSNVTIPAKLVVDFNPLGLSKKTTHSQNYRPKNAHMSHCHK